jgi:uncharacterized protein
MDLLPRGTSELIKRSWQTYPIVVLEGPRAAGKTRLAELLVGRERLFRLDDPGTREVAAQSLRAWIEQLPPGSAIDEAQLIPGVSIEAKRIADDANSQPGRLLLTGSHRLSRTELGGSDPLAGRAKRFTLLPFSQSELAGAPRDVVSSLFDDEPAGWSAPAVTQQEMRSRIVRGGFPGVQNFEEQDLSDWQQTYASSVIGDTTSGRDVEGLRRLFRWLAASSGLEQNVLSFSNANDLNRKTVSEYLNVLRQLFLIFDVPNLATGARQQELPTHLFAIDPIFTAAALKLAEQTGSATSEEGRAFETFVACELTRLLGSSQTSATLHWWKRVAPKPKVEVDLILKRADDQLVAFEVKASREFISQDFAGLRRLRDEFPDRFQRGFLIHCGDNIVRVEENLWAVPFSILWSIGDLLANPVPPSAIPRSTDLFDAVRRLQNSQAVTSQLVEEYGEQFFGQLRDAIGSLLPGLSFSGEPGRTGADAQKVLRVGLRGKVKSVFQIRLLNGGEQPQWTFSWTKADGRSGGSWGYEVQAVENRSEHASAILELLKHAAAQLQPILDDLRSAPAAPPRPTLGEAVRAFERNLES